MTLTVTLREIQDIKRRNRLQLNYYATPALIVHITAIALRLSVRTACLSQCYDVRQVSKQSDNNNQQLTNYDTTT